jgi:hypothetical protein
VTQLKLHLERLRRLSCGRHKMLKVLFIQAVAFLEVVGSQRYQAVA